MQVKRNAPMIRDNYIYNLLKYYGVDDVKTYLSPGHEALIDPTKLENIRAGAELLIKTCEANGSILLIVDCDCDGFTSAAIFYGYVKKVWPNIKIDYRLHEGKAHGLEDHIDWIENNAVYDLIVCPDSSSNDKEYHDRLIQYGIPVLVLDHHITDVELSENAIVINNQLSPEYENKDNTGAGIVYQFCRYLDLIMDNNFAKDFIDLAALGIDGDMGSLLSLENRYIMLEGFKNINNFFFKVLFDKQAYSMKNKCTPISVAFYIVPLINAMIRVGTMAEKTRLFEAFINGTEMVPSNKRGAKGTMEMVAIESARECTNARNHQNKAKEEMVSRLAKKIEDENLLDNKILFVKLDDDMDFPSELNGLVCMNLVSKYKRPALLGRENSDGEIKGSIRGMNNSALSDLKGFLSDSGKFMYVQGHANAAGFGIESREVEDFLGYANTELLNVDFNDNCYEAQFERSAQDGDLELLIKELGDKDNLWGTDIPEPMIYIKGIPLDNMQIMGKNADTLKITCGKIAYMKFKATDMIQQLKEVDRENAKINVIGRGNINEWMGNKTSQIFIEDFEIVKNSIFDF